VALAQFSLQASAGVRYATRLVHDSIVTPFDVQPALAPAVTLTGIAPLQHGWAAQVALDYTRGNLERHDADGSRTDIGTVGTLGLTVGLTHRLRSGLLLTFAAGGVTYLPSDKTGLFRSGSGAIKPIGSVAIARPLPFGAHQHLALELRYDLHGFTTPALRDEGFTSGTAVHRVTLSLRAGGKAP
jgi:hypothetical protein